MTPVVTPTTTRAERRRSEILDIAVRHFNQSGLGGATLAAIAADVGLVTNGIAYYYRRKEDLAAACLIRSIAMLSDLIVSALAAPGPAEDRLARLCTAWFRGLAAGALGKAAPVMRFDDIRALTQPHADTVFAAYSQMFRSLRRVFDETPVAADRVARNARTHLLLAIFHAAQQWFEFHDPEDHAQVAGRLATLLAGGLAPGATRCSGPALPLPAAGDPARDDPDDQPARLSRRLGGSDRGIKSVTGSTRRQMCLKQWPSRGGPPRPRESGGGPPRR
jgi:AcrR family transcriptional regulator